jgi:16S rRNA (guanine1207-N2)-methyltransferase
MIFTDSGEIFLLALPTQSLIGRVLLIQPDSELVGKVLREQGVEVDEWSWNWSKREVTIWPKEQMYDAVILRLPAIRELCTMAIEIAASRLKLGAPLFVYGANHEGMKSLKDHLAPWFEGDEVLVYKHRERVVKATRSAFTDGMRPTLDDWKREYTLEFAGKTVNLVSYPGMFAHGILDEGTNLLLEHLPTCKAQDRVLDMGCGNGVLARALQERTPDVFIDAVDINAFALEATKKNVAGVQTHWGDGWRALSDNAKYHFIISNPPVHAGLRQTTEMLEYFIKNAKQHLLPNGLITLVVQGTIPANTVLKQNGFTTRLVAENKTYRIWEGK